MQSSALSYMVLGLSVLTALQIKSVEAANCNIDNLQLKNFLTQSGYLTNSAAINSNAIKRYQRANGIKDTGFIDQVTCEKLTVKLAALSAESTAAELKKDTNAQEPKNGSLKKLKIYGSEGVFNHPLGVKLNGSDGITSPDLILIPPGCLDLASNYPAQEASLAITKEDNLQIKTKTSARAKKLTCLGEFALGRYEVTFAEYDYFARATARSLPDDAGFGRNRNPVINVSWEDANAYVNWLSERTGEIYRLPTETEWEYAARAGSDYIWSWGNELGTNNAACRDCGSAWDFKSPAPVGAFPPNLWGLNELSGNVWEWTCSPFSAQSLFLGLFKTEQPLQNSEENQCAKPTAAAWIMRGGSWFNLAEQLRTGYRTGQLTQYRYKTLGFRVAWNDSHQPITHLKLQITPADAKIWLLNPERLGSDDMKLPFGHYRLRIEKPGFITFDKWLELNSAEQELNIEMKPLNHVNQMSNSQNNETNNHQIIETLKFPLTIKTDPANANITLLDYELPYKSGIELAPGFYRVRIQAAGYETFENVIEVKQQTNFITINLNWIEPFTKMILVRIPAGSVQIGSPRNQINHNADEEPQRQINIATFMLGKYDVTFEQWDACITAGGCNYRPADEGWGRDKRPVINVSWFDAYKFTNWLTNRSGRQYRLPTEAEWEYATRAGTDTVYWWGNDIERDYANCHGCGSQWDNIKTAPVGSFSANQWGLFDMAGNVWKWMCSAYSSAYDGNEERCVGRENKNLRSLRGGSWYNLQRWLRSASRYRDEPNNRNNYTGFRIVGVF